MLKNILHFIFPLLLFTIYYYLFTILFFHFRQHLVLWHVCDHVMLNKNRVTLTAKNKHFKVLA